MARRKRILFVQDALKNGGAERQLALTVCNLPDEWEGRVWSLRGGPFADELARHGAHVDVWSPDDRIDPRGVMNLWKTIHSWRPDVVHAWGAWANLAASMLCRVLGIPVVESNVRSAMPPSRPLLAAFNRSLATIVTGNSLAGLEAARVPCGKARLVRNGIDLSRVPANGQVPREAPPIRVTMTGRMVKGKDYPILLSAARVLAKREPGHWRFVLAGAGPMRDILVAQAQDLVSSGVLEFHDCGLEAMPLVAGCHIGVLLTDPAFLKEACSNSILEYMAVGLPVVCTRAGGNPELVLDGQTGILVEPGSVEDVVAALLKLGSSPTLRRELGAEGRRRVEQHFSVTRMIENTVAIYESVIETRG